MNKLHEVYDLRTGKLVAYYSVDTASEAVVCAYAQLEKKDYNTWDYSKYDGNLLFSNLFVTCGDYCAKLI